MIKISMNVDERAVEDSIDNMPVRFKAKLFEKLKKESIKEKWQNIIECIKAGRKKFALSQKEINDEIKAYRQEKNAKNRH